MGKSREGEVGMRDGSIWAEGVEKGRREGTKRKEYDNVVWP